MYIQKINFNIIVLLIIIPNATDAARARTGWCFSLFPAVIIVKCNKTVTDQSILNLRI